MSNPSGAPLERDVQRAIINLVKRVYPQAWVCHIPNENGGKLTQRQMWARKADGLTAGAPDLAVAWPGAVVTWLEVKRPNGGSVSERQASVHERLRSMGFHVAVVRSVDEAKAAFKAAGVIA